jgi:large subunit ribosomal protein L6
MSRVGKLPVQTPSGVSATLQDNVLTVKGPKGMLIRPLSTEMDVTIDNQSITILRRDDSRQSRALHGLTRALIFNMVHGVSQGFARILEIAGTGYKAEVQGNVLTLNVGYSHPVPFTLPEGIKASVERAVVVKLEGIDKELLGQTAARIRAVRAVEPYKGKGIRYTDERVHRKAGKTGKTGKK